MVAAVHYSKNNNESSSNSGSQILSDLYPDPRSLPAPPTLREPIPSITLSDLQAGKYVSTQARIAYIKTVEKHDTLGEKVVFTGVLEDSTSKTSFVSHKISYPLIRDSVYKIHSAYVHEFPDRSLLLVITEFTKLEPKNVEDIREYSWIPKISAIIRPVRYIFLNGTISTVHSTSGLIKRCNKCRSLILYDSTKCPNECNMGYAWDLRISSKLYDGSGSIKMVLTKDLAAKILNRNLSQLILSASLNENNQYDQPNNNPISTLSLEVPSTFDIMEAVLPENVSPSFYIGVYRIMHLDQYQRMKMMLMMITLKLNNNNQRSWLTTVHHLAASQPVFMTPMNSALEIVYIICLF